jgi:predicted 2-oxoglutarate/Fe(II)-dependent dioxygenase YbiX
MQPKVLNEFITKETAEYINNYLRSKITKDLNPKGFLNLPLNPLNFNSNKDLESKIVHDLLNLIIDSISSKFGFSKSYLKLDRAFYQVLQEGESLATHADILIEVDYSALLYLNDDYEGGEIVFYDRLPFNSNNGTSYKLDKGTLVYFKGDKDHSHEVKKVILGERASLIFFYTINNYKEEEI